MGFIVNFFGSRPRHHSKDCFAANAEWIPQRIIAGATFESVYNGNTGVYKQCHRYRRRLTTLLGYFVVAVCIFIGPVLAYRERSAFDKHLEMKTWDPWNANDVAVVSRGIDAETPEDATLAGVQNLQVAKDEILIGLLFNSRMDIAFVRSHETFRFLAYFIPSKLTTLRALIFLYTYKLLLKVLLNLWLKRLKNIEIECFIIEYLYHNFIFKHKRLSQSFKRP